VPCGYGAEAINPYLAFETIATCTSAASCRRKWTRARSIKRYIKSIGKGLLKVMSKMGISTYQSYCGAQIFDAIGLSPSSSTATSSAPPPSSRHRHGRVAEENVRRQPRRLRATRRIYRTALDCGGEYAYRTRGEVHAWNPDTVRPSSTRCASTRGTATASSPSS
jgi:glutamate synthase (NADPH/NADH) large chain